MSVPKNTTEQMKLAQREQSIEQAHKMRLFTIRWEAREERRIEEDKENGHYRRVCGL